MFFYRRRTTLDPIHRFPIDMVTKILGHMTVKEILSKMIFINKKWYNYIMKDFLLWKYLYLKHEDKNKKDLNNINDAIAFFK